MYAQSTIVRSAPPPRRARRRWHWLAQAAVAAVVLSACSAAQLPSPGPGAAGDGGGAGRAALPAAPAGAAGGAWDALVASARQEGQVVCGCPNIARIKEFVEQEWSSTFPDIRLDWTPAVYPQWPARVETERAAGQYLWDVYFFGTAP